MPPYVQGVAARTPPENSPSLTSDADHFDGSGHVVEARLSFSSLSRIRPFSDVIFLLAQDNL